MPIALKICSLHEPVYPATSSAINGFFSLPRSTLTLTRAGALLAEYFLRQPDDRNELPDAIEEAD